MIKLTNEQIFRFLTPVVSELFNDPTRRFPVEDSFRFADLLDAIQHKAKVCQDQARDIVSRNGGTVGPDNSITYEGDGLMKAQKELAQLNAIVSEFNYKPLIIKADWPKLSLQEALILRPLIGENNAEKNGEKTKKRSREKRP